MRTSTEWIARWTAGFGLILVACLLSEAPALAQRGVVHLVVKQTASQSLTVIRPS